MNPFPLFSGFSGLPHVGIVKYRVLCGYKGNNKCAWMETVTQMCRGDFKIRAHLGDTNRMFSFVVILLPSIHHLSIRVVRSTPKSFLSKSKDTVLKCYFSSKIIKYLIEKKKLGIKLQVTIQLLLSVYLSVWYKINNFILIHMFCALSFMNIQALDSFLCSRADRNIISCVAFS